MTATAAPPVASPKESWTPMIAIALGQALMWFNVAAIPVAMGGMVEGFGVPPTTVGAGIVLYSLSVAGFVMLDAKLRQRFGSVVIFRIVVALFGVAQVLMTFSPVAEVMLVAQLLAGLAAAALAPSLVALIAHHYTGTQQATAVGARLPPRERAAAPCMFVVALLEAMLNFSVPLYIQIIQGRTPLETAVAMPPFNLTVFFTALLVVRLYGRFAPRQIGHAGFALCTVALLWLAFVVRNDWSAAPVMLGLITFGIGQGALVTLMFNVLVTAAPKEIAGDVGSMRGAANNLAAGVGTAVAGALLVGLLSAGIMTRLAGNVQLPPEITSQINLDNITFITNDRLPGVMQNTTATPERVAEAVRVNVESRLEALKMALLLMAAVSFMVILPARRPPDYRPGDIPDNPAPPSPQALRRAAEEAEA